MNLMSQHTQVFDIAVKVKLDLSVASIYLNP